MRKVGGEHPFCVLTYMNSYIFHMFHFIYFIVISNISFCILDVIIGRHIWNCQIRTHIHTGYTHTGTHTKKEKRKVERLERLEKLEKKKKKRVGNPKKKEKKEMGIQERKKEGKKKDRTKREGGNEGGK